MSGVTIVQIVDTSTTVSTTGDAVTIVQGVENAGPPGPAVIDASYLVLGTNTTLTAERVLTAGTGIDFTDAGAGSTLTVDVDPSEFANGTVPIASLASTPLLLTGGTMTGQLTLTRASAADVALIARLAADTQGRYRVDAYGRQWWDPSGAAATPPIYNTAFVSGGYGLLIYGFDDASITSGSPAGFQVVAARGAHPHFILTALNGTGASPTKLLTGDTLGEFAFQGQYGSTIGQIVTGAALITYAVEDWTLSGGTGAALSLQTRPRGPAYGGIRVESLLIFDSGQIQMDPGDARGGGVTWTLPNSRLRVVSQSATERTLVLKAHASQSENIQEWRNSAETVLAAIDETGAGSFAAGTTVGGTTVAPSDASYVVLGTNGTLANERVLTEGTGIDITDAGAGSTVTIAVDPSEFTNGSVPLASIADIATARLLGRTTAGSGAIEQLTSADSFVSAASDTTAGKVELAIASEVNTGTDATRAVTPDSLAGSEFGVKLVEIMASDMSTAITTGDGKAGFMVPASMNGMNLIRAHAALLAAQSSSGTPTIQIRNATQTADMLSTRITIDANESTSHTAATPPVVDTSNDDVATGDLLYVDVDVAGTGAKGLLVTLEFQLP